MRSKTPKLKVGDVVQYHGTGRKYEGAVGTVLAVRDPAIYAGGPFALPNPRREFMVIVDVPDPTKRQPNRRGRLGGFESDWRLVK